MTLRVAFLIILFSLGVTAVRAQEKIVVPLRLNLEVQQFSSMVVAERMDDGPLIYTSPAGNDMAHAPGKVLFKLQPVEGSPNTYNLFIDANGDGDLRNETPKTLAPERWPWRSGSVMENVWRHGRESTRDSPLRDRGY